MTTISQLQTSVDAWLARDDVAVSGSDFDEILLLAESSIARGYRFGIQEAQTTLNFTGRSADLPADFLEIRNPFIDDNIRRLEYKTPQAIRESNEWTNGRVASSYTIEGNGAAAAPDNRMQVTIAGPASVASPLNLVVNYYARFAALDTGTPTDTNWLLQNHFDVYLYETLRAAAEYIREYELEDRYGNKVMMLRDEFGRHENRKRWGAEPKQPYGNPRMII